VSVISFVDTHCHLDHHETLSVAAQVARARDAGVRTMITVGTDMASSTQAVATARRFDGVWAAVAVHPNDAIEATPQVLEVIDHLAADEVVVAVGETGLDYYRDHATPQQQQQAFRAHIDIARERGRALVIHCRDAWPDLLDILDDHGAPDRVVMHCFSGGLDVTAHCVERGWFLSYAGNVTFTNAADLRAAAAATPLELMLTETDSPYLTPHPHRGEANDPSYLPLTVQALAELKGADLATFATQVRDNARRAFGLSVCTEQK
jgi:TatD DNase family protein